MKKICKLLVLLSILFGITIPVQAEKNVDIIELDDSKNYDIYAQRSTLSTYDLILNGSGGGLKVATLEVKKLSSTTGIVIFNPMPGYTNEGFTGDYNVYNRSGIMIDRGRPFLEKSFEFSYQSGATMSIVGTYYYGAGTGFGTAEVSKGIAFK